jgi:hypothetical protein
MLLMLIRGGTPLTFFKVLFFAIAALVAVSSGTASAASITSCTISNGNTNQVLAQNSGETSCSAHVDAAFPDKSLDAQALWTHNGGLFFGAWARATAYSDWANFPPRAVAVAEGWVREDFYFADAPIGSTLRIDWRLLPTGGDSGSVYFTMAG